MKIKITGACILVATLLLSSCGKDKDDELKKPISPAAGPIQLYTDHWGDDTQNV